MSYNGYRRGHWISSVIIVVLLLLIVAGGVYFLMQGRNSGVRTEKRVENPPAVVEIEMVVTGEALQEKLRGIGELATEEYACTEVGSYASSRAAELFGANVQVPLTRTNIIYSYDGVIRAGIDCAGITVEKDDTLKRIRVCLPAAKVLSTEFLPDSFRVYDDKANLFNPIQIASLADVNPVLLENAATHAVDNGLLERADEHARILVKTLLEGAFKSDEYIVAVETAV